MLTYEVRYELIGNKMFFLEVLAEILEKQHDIDFYINGLIIRLVPGMGVKEIEKEIYDKNDEFEKNNTYVEIGEDEALISFAKRMAKLACDNHSNYSSTYRGHQIKAVPGCTDFDILYQIIQINLKHLDRKYIEYVEMTAAPGQDYMQFGRDIQTALRFGKNILAHFNSVTIPFMKDMTRVVNYSNGEKTTDAVAFSMMFHNMQNSMDHCAYATEGCLLETHKQEVEEYGSSYLSKELYWDTIARLNHSR